MDSSALLKLASSAAHEAIADLQRAIVNYTAKGDAFTSEKPRLWTDQSIAEVGTARNYDLHPDGKRIVALMPVETPEAQKAQNHVIFLENFFDELRRKVPVGK